MQRGKPNIWTFASYATLKSRMEPIFEYVQFAALQLRVAVYAANDTNVGDLLGSPAVGDESDWD